MKTRRNKKNEQEGLIKLKEIRDSTKKYVNELIKCAQEREIVKKNYAESLQLEFELEALNYIKGDKSALENKIKEFLQKVQVNKYKPSESKKRIHSHEECTTLEASNKTSFNYSSRNKEKINELSTKDLVNTNANIVNTNHSHSHTNKVTKNLLQNGTNLLSGSGASRTLPQKRQKNKPPVLIEDNFPKITDILNLVEEEKPEEEISLMHRIRFNRKGKLVIDRYFKFPNSTNPFDNSFDNGYNAMKKYEEDLGKIKISLF